MTGTPIEQALQLQVYAADVTVKILNLLPPGTQADGNYGARVLEVVTNALERTYRTGVSKGYDSGFDAATDESWKE